MKTKNFRNKYDIENNKQLKLAIKRSNEVAKQIEIINGRSYLNKNLLLSPTRYLNVVSELATSKIPNHILEQAATVGKQVMLCLEKMVKHRITNLTKITFLSEQVEKCFYAFIQHCLDNNGTIKAVEQHFINEAQTGHCYADLVITDCFGNWGIVEIKTRSTNEVRLTDLLQLLLNMKIAHKSINNGYLVIINKKDYTVHTTKVNRLKLSKYFKLMGELFKNSKLDSYIL